MPRARDEGFTLIEVMVAMLLAGILGSIAVFGLITVQHQLEARGSHREVTTQIRATQVRSVTEDVAYCVDFGTTPTNVMTTYRVSGADLGVLPAGFACSSGTKTDTYKLPGKTTFSSVSFQQRNGAFTTYALFYARGAASAGSFRVGGGGGNTYTISVDGLTGRVADSGI